MARAMASLILSLLTPLITLLLLVFSLFVTLRGHHEPGGGFIGGLIATLAFALVLLAEGPEMLRRIFGGREPLLVAGVGLGLAVASGLVSLALGRPFMTGFWWHGDVAGYTVDLGTPMLFDMGVALVVVGGLTGVALAIEENVAELEEEEESQTNEVQEPAAPGGSARVEPSLVSSARANARGAEPSQSHRAKL